MKPKVSDSLQDFQAAEKGLILYLAENPETRVVMLNFIDDTDFHLYIHKRIFTAIMSLPIDARRHSETEVRELLVKRGDHEAARYFDELSGAERPYSWSEALRLAVHIVLLAEYRQMMEYDNTYMEIDEIDDCHAQPKS